MGELKNIDELKKCLYRDKGKCKTGVNGNTVKCFMYKFENGNHICFIDELLKQLKNKK